MSVGGRWQVLMLVMGLQVPGLQPQDTRGALIVGQVIDAATKRPVAGAVVSIPGPPASNGQPRLAVLTGTDGRFLFRDLSRGNYNITVIKGGYADGAHGRTRPGGASLPLSLNDGERRDDIVVRLWRHAAISGTVTDESGERQVAVQIRAYRRSVAGGKRRYVPAGSASTDDRGIYRIGTLIPGDYIIGTAPRHQALPLSMIREGNKSDQDIFVELTNRIGPVAIGDTGYVLGRGGPPPPPPAGGRLVIYPAVFHPAAAAGEAATVITLQPGEHHDSADIQIIPAQTVSVSGFIIGPDGPVTSTSLRLLPAGGIEVPADTDGLFSWTDPKGGFVFPAVPSGHYTLKLTRGAVTGFIGRGNIEPPLIWVDLPLSVGTEDILNLGVTANAGLRISGRFEFEGDPARPRGSLQNVQIMIEPADTVVGALARPIVARANAAGEFTSPALPGGRYYVRIADSPSGWMFKGATHEGRDVADIPLTLAAGVDNVTVQFTDRWSGLSGRVLPDSGLAVGEVAVIIFPTDSDSWGSSGQSPRRLRLARAGKGGEYSLNLPAGDYYVLAVPEDRAADWQDQAFLEEASRSAVRVRIADGERKVQDVRVRVTR